MATAPANTPGAAPKASQHGPAPALPDWLMALDTRETPPAPPPAPTPPATGTPASTTTTPLAETTSSLLGEEDLPAWLKALAAPQPEPPPPPAAATTPAWLSQGTTLVSSPTPLTPKAAEAPPIWNTRPARLETDGTLNAPIFASLDAAVVSGAPAEVEPPPPVPEASRGTPWGMLALAALVMVVVLAAVALYVMMR